MKLKITSRSERERGREKERGGGDRQRVSTQSFEHGSGHARKSTMCAHSLLSPPSFHHFIELKNPQDRWTRNPNLVLPS